jgi:hypothetical protein
MLKLFKKKSSDGLQDNSVVGLVQEITTHALNGGTAGVNIAIDYIIYQEVYNWAKRHKDKGEDISREKLMDKVNKQFFGSRVFAQYSKACGYNSEKVNQLVDNVMANL